jgi:hypothetical protein
VTPEAFCHEERRATHLVKHPLPGVLGAVETSTSSAMRLFLPRKWGAHERDRVKKRWRKTINAEELLDGRIQSASAEGSHSGPH